MWGCITWEGVGFSCKIDETLDAELYAEILEELNIQVMSWPAQSPDLNPIEHFWEFVDRKLKGFEEMVASKEELWERIESIVQEINKDCC